MGKITHILSHQVLKDLIIIIITVYTQIHYLLVFCTNFSAEAAASLIYNIAAMMYKSAKIVIIMAVYKHKAHSMPLRWGFLEF